MKYGKIYTWANREEARHLIGKRVKFSDGLKSITESNIVGIVGVLKDIQDDDSAFIENKGCSSWCFIREIEEDTEELMTNMQLAEWCAKGKGCWSDDVDYVYQTSYSVVTDCKDDPVSDDIKICRWGSDEWIKPTKAVYEQDCKEKTE